MSDTYDLQRFVDAQSAVLEEVRAELRAGHKRSHWMWFVFPQIKGLGHSSTAQKYAISGRAEAEAYLMHPVLGPRLRECTQLVNAVEGRNIQQILGSPDDLKFRSSMTLFSQVTTDKTVFEEALRKYCSAAPDQATLDILQQS